MGRGRSQGTERNSRFTGERPEQRGVWRLPYDTPGWALGGASSMWASALRPLQPLCGGDFRERRGKSTTALIRY